MSHSKLPPQPLLRHIQRFAKQHSNLEEPYYARGDCWNASVKFVNRVRDIPGNKLELSVMCVGDDLSYKKYCADKTCHWVVAVGQWRIDFTARQFHKWFAFPRVWKETRKQCKHGKNGPIGSNLSVQ